MNGRAIRTLIRKDLTVVLRSKAVTIPLIIVPILLQVVMPAGFGVMAAVLPSEETAGEIDELRQVFSAMPESVASQLAGLQPNQAFFVLMLVYLFAPLYLIVPLMVASVIAADSFAGEKERKTLEALLHTPLTSQELIVGKLLSAWLPALAVSLISFVLYGVVVNVAAWLILGRLIFPNLMWIVLVFWVAPAASGLGLSATVLVSSKVRTFQEAYQLGGVVVVPVVALMIGQFTGLLFFSPLLALIIGVVLWFIDGVLLLIAVDTFQRGELMAQL
jgi:ABC-type Na+ efflux pump permease subunit